MPDRWLNREEQAAHLGVGVDTIAQYVRRYGPTNPNPFPTHVDGQHKRFGRSIAVLESALTAWNERRVGPQGRPRTRPPGITPAQHRALADIAASRTTNPRLTIALLAAGMLQGGAGRVTLNRKGRAVLAEYPVSTNQDEN
jgi:transposase